MLIYLLFIFFGLIWGSFSNALIYRLPLRISLVDPKRSQCPHCKSDISWKDNFPILSWLLLKGRCRNCKTKISWVYPLVELANALAAVICIVHYQHIPTALLTYFLISILIVITFIDLEHMIIPDRINKPGMAVGILVGTLNQFYHLTFFPFSQTFLESVIGLAFGYGLLYLIAWGYLKASGVSGLGGGDIKLMGFIGALFGPYCIPSILITGSLVGVVVGLSAIIAKRYSLRSEMPFGPSLAIGIIIYAFGFDTIALINEITARIFFPSLIHG